MTVRVIIEHDGDTVSAFTLREKEARAFLDGRILKMEFGTYNSSIPACCHAKVKIKKEKEDE